MFVCEQTKQYPLPILARGDNTLPMPPPEGAATLPLLRIPLRVVRLEMGDAGTEVMMPNPTRGRPARSTDFLDPPSAILVTRAEERCAILAVSETKRAVGLRNLEFPLSS